MHFSNPSALWLLWLLPPLAALYLIAGRRRAAALRRFADEALLGQLLPPRSTARNVVRATLVGLAMLGVLVSAAGPRWGFEWEDVSRRGVDLVVALDLSRSMLAEDISPDRLTAAKREITDLLDLLQGDRVSLVVFAGTAFVQCPLTLDYRAFEVFLDQLTPNSVPVGGTDLAAAVRTSVAAFVEGDRSGRAVLLITDGEDHSGELAKATEEAKEAGVHVFVVGIGAPQGAPVPDGRGGFVKEAGRVVLSKLDEPALKELAIKTGGSYVRSVAGDLDLREIYLEDIKGTLEARELSSSRQKRWEERYQWFLLPALLLLVLEGLLGPPRRRDTLPGGGSRDDSGSGPGSTGGGRGAGRAGGSEVAASFLLCLALAAGAALTLAPSRAQAGWFGGDNPNRLGAAAFEDGDFQAALDHWITAQVADPTDRRLDYNIGEAHYRLGQFPEAERAFRVAAATDRTELAADALYNAGNALFEQGRYQEAIAAYEECLAIRPKDEDAIHNRDLAQRRYEELLDQANQQQQDQPDQPPQDQQQQEEQEDEDASADQDSPPGDEGQDGESQEQQQQQQQQGQGKSEEEQEAEQQQGEGEQEKQDESEQTDEAEEGADDAQAEKTQDQQQGGAAEAADIDRQGDAEDDSVSDAAIEDKTEPGDGAQDNRPASVIEGALTEEQAEALLQALDADQANRREERTKREAQRGRKAAKKDW